MNSFQSSVSSNGSVHQEALLSHGSDKFIEAYVSAVNSATHFWLQVGVPGLCKTHLSYPFEVIASHEFPRVVVIFFLSHPTINT